MKPTGPVFILRRFWPLPGGIETVAAGLAGELAAGGAKPTVLTARWQKAWPRKITFGEVHVVRLAHAPRGAWGTWQWASDLRTYLRDHCREIDLAWVGASLGDAESVLAALGPAGVPVVLRADVDLCGEKAIRRVQQLRRSVAALVASSEVIRADLIAAGFPREKICTVPDGVAIPPRRDRRRRSAARRALAKACSDLAIDDDAPLAVYTGRLTAGRGLSELIDAWRKIAGRRPRARLWLVGEGPLRAMLAGRVDRLSLGGRVVLPGPFDDVGDILAAADLFVLPSDGARTPISLLEAMAAGLPTVAADSAAHRAAARNEQHALLVRRGNNNELTAAIGRLLDDRQWAARLGAAARDHAVANFSLDRMTRGYCELFERIGVRGLENAPRRRAPESLRINNQ